MELIEALRAAKHHLKVTEYDRSWMSQYICYAIEEAFLERYGVAEVNLNDRVNMMLRKAINFVAEKLRNLQKALEVPSSNAFDRRTAERYVYEGVDKQVARHLWLDQLIQELT